VSLRRPILRLVPLVALSACGGSSPGLPPTPTPTPPPNYCTSPPSAYGQKVVDWWLPACTLGQNIYSNPEEVLGPPNASGSGPDHYAGFMSLGFGGYVTVDMGGCIQDRPGYDIRVFQIVGNEPVSVYASESPDGPFVFLDRKNCPNTPEGRINHLLGYCDFDLASGGLSRARYIKIEDGELYPCPGDTVTEGADIDAVQALSVPTASLPGGQ
jgi:hypothetical protein